MSALGLALLVLANAWVWGRVWRQRARPGRRPSWGSRLEARLAQTCPWCGHRSRHTVREHIRVPQAILRAREGGEDG
jgi:hypothetical protein